MPPETNDEIRAVQELFERLCEQPPEQREAALADCPDGHVRRRVGRLLEHYDRTESPLELGLLSQGRPEEAEALLRELPAESTLEPAPATLELLGVCRLWLQDFAEAAALLEEAIRVNRPLEGDLHPSSLRMRFNLAAALVRSERYPEAVDALQQVIAGHLAQPNPPIPSVVSSELLLAKVLCEMGRPDEADRMGRSALERARNQLGEGHPLTQRARASVEAAER